MYLRNLSSSSADFLKQNCFGLAVTLSVCLLLSSNPVLCNKLRHHHRRFYDEQSEYEKHVSEESNALQEPIFDSSQTDEVNVPWGRNAYLHCAVRNKNGKVKLAWTRLRDGILLTVDNQSFADPTKYFVSYVDQDNDYILVIKNTNLDDSGLYQCELSTPLPQRRLVKLTVTANEGELIGTRETSSGGLITLICRIKVISPNRQLPAALIWYHNDSNIRFVDNGGRARKKVSTKDDNQVSETVEIVDARPEDVGLYRCAPTPDTLGGTQLTLSIDVIEGAAGNRLSARNTPQKSNFIDGRLSRSSSPNALTFAQLLLMVFSAIISFC